MLFYSLYFRVSDSTVYFHQTHLTAHEDTSRDKLLKTINKKKFKKMCNFCPRFVELGWFLYNFDMHNRKASGLAVNLTYSLSTLANFDIASYHEDIKSNLGPASAIATALGSTTRINFLMVDAVSLV